MTQAVPGPADRLEPESTDAADAADMARLAAGGDAVTVTSRSGAEVPGLTVAKCDVRDAAAVDAAFAAAEAEHGPVEVAVANAGNAVTVVDANSLAVGDVSIIGGTLSGVSGSTVSLTAANGTLTWVPSWV